MSLRSSRAKRRREAWLLGAFALGVFMGCGEPMPSPPTLTPAPPRGAVEVVFAHRLGGAPLVAGQERLLPGAVRVRVDDLSYLLGGLELEGAEATLRASTAPGAVALEGATARLDDVPVGVYDALTLQLGDPGVDTFAAGLDVLRVEGSFERRGEGGPYALRLAHTSPDLRLARGLPTPIEVREDETARVEIPVILDRLFTGLNLAVEPRHDDHTGEGRAEVIAKNLTQMFDLPPAPVRTSEDPASTLPRDATPPVLSRPFVATEALRCEVPPSMPAEQRRGCVTPFRRVPGSAAIEDAGRLTLVTRGDAAVYASAPGVVEAVEFVEHSHITHSDLFRVRTRAHGDAAFWLEYERLKEPRVQPGDTVEAGQRLGTVGDWFDEGFGAASLTVRRTQAFNQVFCPLLFADDAVRQEWERALEQNNAAGTESVHDALCEGATLVCASEPCTGADALREALGDLDSGRIEYQGACAVCHGASGEGDIGPALCPGCDCLSCGSAESMAARTQVDMPPEGECDASCAENIAAFIFATFEEP